MSLHMHTPSPLPSKSPQHVSELALTRSITTVYPLDLFDVGIDQDKRAQTVPRDAHARQDTHEDVPERDRTPLAPVASRLPSLARAPSPRHDASSLPDNPTGPRSVEIVAHTSILPWTKSNSGHLCTSGDPPYPAAPEPPLACPCFGHHDQKPNHAGLMSLHMHTPSPLPSKSPQHVSELALTLLITTVYPLDLFDVGIDQDKRAQTVPRDAHARQDTHEDVPERDRTPLAPVASRLPSLCPCTSRLAMTPAASQTTPLALARPVDDAIVADRPPPYCHDAGRGRRDHSFPVLATTRFSTAWTSPTVRAHSPAPSSLQTPSPWSPLHGTPRPSPPAINSAPQPSLSSHKPLLSPL
nr:extensin-like [Lolium perenne]